MSENARDPKESKGAPNAADLIHTILTDVASLE